MNASQPTDFNVSLAQLLTSCQSQPYCHWGIVCYEGKGCRSFLEPNTRGLSPLTHLLEQYPIRSQMAIARLNRCQQRYSLAESEPFTREWHGQYWSCCVEGALQQANTLPLGHPLPIGDSLGERLFCHLLHRMEQLSPPLSETELLLALATEIQPQLDTDGRLLLCNEQYLLLLAQQPLYWQERRHLEPQSRSVLVSSHHISAQHDTDPDWCTAPGGYPLLFRNGVLLTP